MCIVKLQVVVSALSSLGHPKAIALCGKAVFKGQKSPILDTLGKTFSWIRLIFLEVVLQRASVRELSDQTCPE